MNSDIDRMWLNDIENKQFGFYVQDSTAHGNSLMRKRKLIAEGRMYDVAAQMRIQWELLGISEVEFGVNFSNCRVKLFGIFLFNPLSASMERTTFADLQDTMFLPQNVNNFGPTDLFSGFGAWWVSLIAWKMIFIQWSGRWCKGFLSAWLATASACACAAGRSFDDDWKPNRRQRHTSRAYCVQHCDAVIFPAHWRSQNKK